MATKTTLAKQIEKQNERGNFRTDRLNDFLSKVHINWTDELASSQGWQIIRVTIGKTNALVLDMREAGYQVFPIDEGPAQGEPVDREIERLSKGTFVPDSADASDALLETLPHYRVIFTDTTKL